MWLHLYKHRYYLPMLPPLRCTWYWSLLVFFQMLECFYTPRGLCKEHSLCFVLLTLFTILYSSLTFLKFAHYFNLLFLLLIFHTPSQRFTLPLSSNQTNPFHHLWTQVSPAECKILLLLPPWLLFLQDSDVVSHPSPVTSSYPPNTYKSRPALVVKTWDPPTTLGAVVALGVSKLVLSSWKRLLLFHTCFRISLLSLCRDRL